ncbi:MAG: hypothetical protein P8Z00_23165 [Anaerolineales bacterium]|jgi:hypothetical protein
MWSRLFNMPTSPSLCRIPMLALLLLWGVLAGILPPPAAAERVDNWLDVVRQTPYWASQGVARNLATIRRWVLLSEGYCSKPQRQILFDRHGRFVGFIDNADNAAATTRRLNEARERLAAEHRVADWSPGTDMGQGYPFALSCDQPYVDMNEAIARMVGSKKDYRLWGTWDGMRVGSANSPVSLVTLIRTVYEHLEDQGRISFPASVMPAFMGKTIIESGGKKHALSTESARGIMQLQPSVLDDCEIPKDFRLHRMAQVDCALRLVEQNDRNLQQPFNAVFGKLPEKKRQLLYHLLLTQAYQIGVGRTIELLQDEKLGKAARYFTAHADHFSAGDIQVGMIYHNLGRRNLGMLTLYYVTDVGIATEALCASRAMSADAWCDRLPRE